MWLRMYCLCMPKTTVEDLEEVLPSGSGSH